MVKPFSKSKFFLYQRPVWEAPSKLVIFTQNGHWLGLCVVLWVLSRHGPFTHKLLKAISFDLSVGFCALFIIGSSWEVDYDREVVLPSDFIFMWCKGLECRSSPTSLFSSLLTSFSLGVIIISFDLFSGFSIATCWKQAPDKDRDGKWSLPKWNYSQGLNHDLLDKHIVNKSLEFVMVLMVYECHAFLLQF